MGDTPMVPLVARAVSPSLRSQLTMLDTMAGCTTRSVSAVQASWKDTYLLSFREAYEVGRDRYGLGTPEHVAFLEGCLAVQSLATHRGDGT